MTPTPRDPAEVVASQSQIQPSPPKRSVLVLTATLITDGAIAARNERTYAGLPPQGVIEIERRLIDLDLSLLNLGCNVAGVPGPDGAGG